MERFSLDLPRAVEKECTLEVGCGGVCNLKLGQAIKNISSGGQ